MRRQSIGYRHPEGASEAHPAPLAIPVGADADLRVRPCLPPPLWKPSSRTAEMGADGRIPGIPGPPQTYIYDDSQIFLVTKPLILLWGCPPRLS